MWPLPLAEQAFLRLTSSPREVVLHRRAANLSVQYRGAASHLEGGQPAFSSTIDISASTDFGEGYQVSECKKQMSDIHNEKLSSVEKQQSCGTKDNRALLH